MRARDEHDLALSYELERRLDRDDEHERFDQRRQRTSSRPRYSRFRTLARISANRAACVVEQAALANNGKRAA